MYIVVSAFTDLQDNNYIYQVGDEYPRRGFKASDERIASLSSTDNKIGLVLIERVEDKKETKRVAEPTETADIPSVTDETAEVEEKDGKPKKADKKEK